MPLLRVLLLLLLLPSPAVALSRSGVVQRWVHEWDTADGPVAYPERWVLQRNRRHRLPVADDPRLVPGAKVRVRGTLTPAGLLVPDLDVRGVTLLTLPPITTAHAVERLLVLPLDFVDHPRTGTLDPSRYAWMAELMAGQSYGHTRLDITLRPWKTSPRTVEDGSTLACDFAGLVAEALRVHAPEVDYRAFTLVNVVVPDFPVGPDAPCPGGAAGGAYIGRVLLDTPHGMLPYGIMVTGEGFGASTHELGHALGLAHANALDCGRAMLPPDPTSACLNREYGDVFDVMGQAWGDYQALFKRQLGWLSALHDERALVLGPTGGRLVWAGGVSALEQAAAPGVPTVKALFLPRATSPPTWLTVEARFVLGRDQFYPDDWLAGVVVHTALAPVWLPTLDADGVPIYAPVAPNQAHLVWPTPTHTIEHATLPVGQHVDDWPWRVTVVDRDLWQRETVVRVEDLRVFASALCQTDLDCPVEPVTGEAGTCHHFGICCYHGPGHECQVN